MTLNPGDFHQAMLASIFSLSLIFLLVKINVLIDLGRLDNKKDVKEVFSNLSNYFEQMANDDQFIDSIIQWAGFDLPSLLHQPKSYKVSKSVKMANINNVPPHY